MRRYPALRLLLPLLLGLLLSPRFQPPASLLAVLMVGCAAGAVLIRNLPGAPGAAASLALLLAGYLRGCLSTLPPPPAEGRLRGAIIVESSPNDRSGGVLARELLLDRAPRPARAALLPLPVHLSGWRPPPGEGPGRWAVMGEWSGARAGCGGHAPTLSWRPGWGRGLGSSRIFRVDRWKACRLSGSTSPRGRWGEKARLGLRGRLQVLLSPGSAALLTGVLLGESRALSPGVLNEFRRTGVAHVLAVSGLHAGVVVLILVLLARLLRLPPRAHLLVVAPGLLAYVVLTGARPSVIRAALMAGALLGGTALQRPVEPLNSVGVAALALLLWNPSVLTDVGFQLSFAATGGILIGLSTGGRAGIAARGRLRRALSLVVAAGRVTISAQAATLPLMVWHFAQVSLIATAANLLVVPALGLLLPLGALAILLSSACPPLAGEAALSTEAMARLLLAAVHHLARVPGAAIGVGRPLVGLSCAVGLGVLATLASPSGGRGRRWGALLLVTSTALLLWLPLARPPGPLRLHFLDVGQGDACIMEFPGGEVVVLDGGPRGLRWDAGERIVVPFLRRAGIHRIDLLALSHAQGDHVGGLPAIAQWLSPSALLEPGLPRATGAYRDLLRGAIEQGVVHRRARRGGRLGVGRWVLTVLNPPPDLPLDSPLNDASLVVWGEREGPSSERLGPSFLLTGDIERSTEAELVRAIPDLLGAQLLKVAHHGSRTSTTAEFIEVVRPQEAVISVGEGNRFGHPAPEVLRRLAEGGARIHRTDREGSLTLVAGWRGWEVRHRD